MLLFFDALAHLLVDAMCASAMFGPMRASGSFASLILLYNTLAFSTQCLVGIAADRLNDVLAALEKAHYTVLDVREKGEWRAACARKE